MGAMPGLNDTPGPGGAASAGRDAPRFGPDAFSRRWAALLAAGAALAQMAGLAAEPPCAAHRNLPATLHGAPAWRRALAAQALDDLAAVLEPGLAALRAVEAGGADPQAAALALWHEFVTARAALLALAPPPARRR